MRDVQLSMHLEACITRHQWHALLIPNTTKGGKSAGLGAHVLHVQHIVFAVGNKLQCCVYAVTCAMCPCGLHLQEHAALLELNDALHGRARQVLEQRNKGRPAVNRELSRLDGADARYRWVDNSRLGAAAAKLAYRFSARDYRGFTVKPVQWLFYDVYI